MIFKDFQDSTIQKFRSRRSQPKPCSACRDTRSDHVRKYGVSLHRPRLFFFLNFPWRASVEPGFSKAVPFRPWQRKRRTQRWRTGDDWPKSKKKHFLMTHISYTYPFLLICWKAETKVESRNYKTKWNGKNVQELYRHTCIVPYQIIRGSLVRKLPSYGRLSMASCLTIMATTSSCQSHHHQVPRKCERSGTRKCTAENTLGRKTLFFFG